MALDNISHKVSGVSQWIVASGYPLVICTEKGVYDAVKKARTMSPYKGDIKDMLSAEREGLVELLKKVASDD